MGIKVTVKLYAQLGEYLPPKAANNQIVLEVAAGTTPETLFRRFKIPPEYCHLVLVNGVYLEPSRRGEHPLQDKDALAVWPPIAGG